MVTAWPPRTGHDHDRAKARGTAASARDQRRAQRGGPLTWAPAGGHQPGGKDHSSAGPRPAAADACPDGRRLAPRIPSPPVRPGRPLSQRRPGRTVFPARGRKQRRARTGGAPPEHHQPRPRPSRGRPARADCPVAHLRGWFLRPRSPGSPGALLLINNLRVPCGLSNLFGPRTWASSGDPSPFCSLMLFQFS